jgi:hypothetical protein
LGGGTDETKDELEVSVDDIWTGHMRARSATISSEGTEGRADGKRTFGCDVGEMNASIFDEC